MQKTQIFLQTGVTFSLWCRRPKNIVYRSVFASTHISFSSICSKVSPCMYCCNYPSSSTKHSRKSLKTLCPACCLHNTLQYLSTNWVLICIYLFGPKDWEHAKSREVPNPTLKEHHSHPSPPEPHQQATPSCKLPDQLSTLESPCHLTTWLPAYTWQSLWCAFWMFCTDCFKNFGGSQVLFLYWSSIASRKASRTATCGTCIRIPWPLTRYQFGLLSE
jgi:hypothetical protein